MNAKYAFVPNFVGTPVERIEDLRLLRGRGQFVDDLHCEGMLHAAILRSSVAHGRIRSIDFAAARAIPGVRGIFTAEDVVQTSNGSVPTVPLRVAPLPQLVPFEQPVIAHTKVRYVGEPIAVVVADSVALAEDALDAIVLDIEPLPAVADRNVSARNDVQLPMERIRIFHGSTTYLKEGFGSFHSRSVVMGGSAILAAAENLKEVIRRAAAPRLGCAASDVVIGEGLIAFQNGKAGGNSVALSELAGEGLSAEGTFANHHHTTAYGAAAAHVAVDARTGHVEVLDYVMVEDIGRIINPLTANGQAVGAIVQGLGGAFLENLVYDEDGQLLTASLADYMLPTATDFPNIRAIMLENSPSPNNPLGAKGGGEGGTVAVGGVVANAVAAALATLGVATGTAAVAPENLAVDRSGAPLRAGLLWRVMRKGRSTFLPWSLRLKRAART